MVQAIEREIGYRFRNRDLLRSATGTWRRAFGPLEHLGDTIADLAVAVTCHLQGGDAESAAQIVANANLERVFSSRIRRLVSPETGDVIEALVGAVHLDGGFDEAAAVTNRLLVEGVPWRPIEVRKVERLAGTDGPVWLGSLVFDAVVADRVAEVRGIAATSQRELSTTRSVRTSNSALERLVALPEVRRLLSTDIGDVRGLKSATASTLLGHGWSTTRELVVAVLEAGGPLARTGRRGARRQPRR